MPHGSSEARTPTRFLVTGGAGFIGSHLAERLLDRGHRVAVVDDLSTGRLSNIAHLQASPGFRCSVDTIANEALMDRLVADSEIVIHLAAAVGVELIINDPVSVIEMNVLGTHTILKIANRHRRKVLLASTSEIYGKSNELPFQEDDDRLLGPTSRARWSYSSSKAVDEFLALAYHRQFGLPVVIFRLFNTIGPRQTGQYGMVVPRFVQQAILGKPLTVYGDGGQSRCFCDVRDVVRAIERLAASPDAVGQVVNIGSTSEITILELARKIQRLVHEVRPALGGDDELRLVPYVEAYGAGFEDMRRRVPDIERIKRLADWEPMIAIDDSIRAIIASVMAADA
jgi:UDP-glucose 4-epimerase